MEHECCSICGAVVYVPWTSLPLSSISPLSQDKPALVTLLWPCKSPLQTWTRFPTQPPLHICILPVSLAYCSNVILRKCLPPKRRWTYSLVGYDTVPSDWVPEADGVQEWVNTCKGIQSGEAAWLLTLKLPGHENSDFYLTAYAICCVITDYLRGILLFLNWDSQNFLQNYLLTELPREHKIVDWNFQH